MALADHGSHALPLGSATSTATSTFPGDETIHTTANHPWLSADHGWIVASHLQLGEPVQQVDGSVAVVVALTPVHGTAPMWDLTVSAVHDFAVGSGAYVVHNCGMGDSELAKQARQVHKDFRAAYHAEYGVNARRSVVAIAEDNEGNGVASISNSVLKPRKVGRSPLDLFREVAGMHGLTVANEAFKVSEVSIHAEDTLLERLGAGGARRVGTRWSREGSYFCSRCQGIVARLLRR